MAPFSPGNDDGPRALPFLPGSEGGQASDKEGASWQQFAAAATPKAFCKSWLSLQCGMLSGIRCAMLLLGPPDRGPFTPQAVWPDAGTDLTHLAGIAERSLKERRGLLLETDGQAAAGTPFPETHQIAYPLEVGGKLHGVVVCGVDQQDTKEVQRIMRRLHWGAAWLEVLVHRTETAKAGEETRRLQKVLDLIASAVEHKNTQAAAMAVATRLAASLDCDRASLGFVGRRHVRVEAMSHSADFGKQTNLLRAIGAAMDEAVDQQASIVYPPPPDAAPFVTRVHEELARRHDAGAICTVPMVVEGKTRGALMLERPAERPFDPDTVELCEIIAVLIGPILAAKRAEQRWLVRKAAESFALQLGRLIGPGHIIRKLLTAALIAAVVFFSTFHVDYRVAAPIVIEGTVQRVVAAPFDGYLKEAPARPGDIIKKGDLLCLLDDRDLRLEHSRWLTEREQFSKQHQEAVAKHERAQARILRAKIDQADAQITLIEEKLARSRIVAPFDSVVMSGDLSQSLGAPVERGRELFRMAPLDAYRVIVQVDERDIGNIRVGQASELVLPSLPGKSFPFSVEKITPVATAKEGRNYFRVEGRMQEVLPGLRPGMEGIGKISVERRKLIWVWTHEMTDWLRLQLWQWIP